MALVLFGFHVRAELALADLALKAAHVVADERVRQQIKDEGAPCR